MSTATYTIISLSIALILITFFGEKISRNDILLRFIIALVIALSITCGIYEIEQTYNWYWNKQAARIESNVWLNVKTMCDKHAIPKGMKAPLPELMLDGEGYYCRKAAK